MLFEFLIYISVSIFFIVVALNGLYYASLNDHNLSLIYYFTDWESYNSILLSSFSPFVIFFMVYFFIYYKPHSILLLFFFNKYVCFSEVSSTNKYWKIIFKTFLKLFKHFWY